MNKCAVLLSGLFLLCVACSRPADETPSKFQRQANLKKYTRKAQEISRLNRGRFQPLPLPDLPDLSRLRNQTPRPDFSALRQWIDRERQTAQRLAFHAYGVKTAGQIDSLMEKYHEQAVQWASRANPSADFAAYFRELTDAQNRDLQAFASKQASLGRLLPDEAFLAHFQEEFSVKKDEWLKSIRWYYGDKAADSCRPDLDVAGRDCTDILASAPDEETLSGQLQAVFRKLEEQVNKIIAAKGDPFGAVSKEETEKFRSELIAQQQNLEKYLEPLYGKDAVLSARRLFGSYLDESEKVLNAQARLSAKKQALTHLHTDFHERLNAAQTQWNAKYLPGEASLN